MIRDGRFMGMCNMIDHLTKRLWSKPITSKESIHVKAFLIDVFEQIGLEVLEEGEEPTRVMYLRSDNGGEFTAHCTRAVSDVISRKAVTKRRRRNLTE